MKKIIPIPKTRQLKGEYCAVACLKMCLDYYKIKVSQRDLTEYFEDDEFIKTLGVEMDDLVKVASQFNIDGKLVYNLSLEKIISLIKLNIPVLSCIKNYQEVLGNFREGPELKKYLKEISSEDYLNHCIILNGFDLKESYLHIIDPSDLRRSKLDFERYSISWGTKYKGEKQKVNIPMPIYS